MPRSQLKKSQKQLREDDKRTIVMLAPSVYDEAAKLNAEDKARRENAKNLDAAENKVEAPNSEPLVDQEAKGNNVEQPSWKNKVSGKNEPQKASGKLSFIKKKGPLTAIILTLVGGGIGITGLLSPGLLIIQIKETMVGKFNTQLASMDVRTKKIITSKMTGGACTINIACKYKSMSIKQVARFEKSGIKIDYGDSTTFTGRVKPTGIEFKGEKIDAADFYKKLGSDVDFRLSVKKAYNPLFASFYDKVWGRALFYIDKTGIKLDGDDDAAKLDDIQRMTKEAADEANSGKIATDEPDDATKEDFDNPDNYEKALANADEATKEIAEGVQEVTESGQKAATKLAAELSTQTALNTIKITGWLDNACTVYGTMRSVGFAAKTVRVAQLIAYASIFLKIADQIKAGGNPDPKDVEYIGNTLTTEVKNTNADGSTSYKTATDSFGYKYAAYGEVGTMPDSASQFLTGAGLTGTLIGLTSYVNSILGNNANGTCAISQNIFVQLGSAAVGIIVGISTSGASILGQVLQQGITAAVIAIAISYLPELLKDIIAGVIVDDSTVGELSGDAITSGSSSMMGKLASAGGNAPLTIDQALVYANLSSEVAAEYAEEDRIAHSPFDVTNGNTFLGSFVRQLTPYLSSMSSISSAIGSVTSLASNSISMAIAPKTYAATAEEFSICQDFDYTEMELAADPYCNLIYGVPTEVLESIDPIDVLEILESSGDINKETGAVVEGSDLESFQTDCINRQEPIGYSGSDFSVSDGKKCIIGEPGYPNKKYYYLYLIDKRVEDGMSGDDEALEMAYEMGLDQSPNIAFYDGSNGLTQNNVASQSFFSKLINLISSSLTLKKAPQ